MLEKKLYILYLVILLVIISAGSAFSQQTDSTDFYYKQYGRCWFGKVSHQYDSSSSKDSAQSQILTKKEDEDDGRIYIIPVVFHIIHNNGNENIPDSYIYKQIDDLNRDFAATGTYMGKPEGVDVKIKFCLAKYDPYGKPSTGINRVQSAFTNLETSSNKELLTKNLSRWDTKQYLNFWIVKNIDGNDSISGYSFLASEAAEENYDGIVLNFRFVGSNNRFRPLHYNLGKTASHEVGHYLDLLHPWGGDGPGRGGCNEDDGIYDTPICDQPYFAGIRCEEPLQCGFFRMTQNHMDYSRDICANIFTQGQANHMRRALRLYRPSLISYPNMLLIDCDTLYNLLNPITENTLGLYPNPATSFIYLYPRFKEKLLLNISIYDNLGRHISDHNNIEAITERIRIDVPDLRPGIYHFVIKIGDVIYQNKVVILGKDKH